MVWETGRKTRAKTVVAFDHILRHGEAVRPQDPNHAVIFVVNAQAIARESLVRNMDDDEDQELRRVVWKEEHRDDPHQLILCNGETRHTWVAWYCIKDALAAYQRAQHSLTLGSGNAFMHKDDYKKLEIKVQEAMELVEEKSMWGARYYDISKLKQSSSSFPCSRFDRINSRA